MLPLGLPSVPFTLHTEMHQHQHLHHHQHVVAPSYLPPPGSAGLFSNQMSMVGIFQACQLVYLSNFEYSCDYAFVVVYPQPLKPVSLPKQPGTL